MNVFNRSWLLVALAAAVALLPFGRMTEIPLLCLSIFGVIALKRWSLVVVKSENHSEWRLLGLLFLSFWLPMLLSLSDAVSPEKSQITTLGALRYPLFVAGLLWWYQTSADRAPAQDALLSRFGCAVTILLCIWCADALLQFLTGSNLLGYGRGEGYVNGLFGDDDNVKFGLCLALLFPVGFLYLQARKGFSYLAAFTAVCLLLVVLSGKRAAWIVMLVELLCLALFFMWSGQASKRVLQLALVAVLAISMAYVSSDWVRQRSDVLVSAAASRDYETLNAASGKRLPIWGTALRMGEDHWLNGVGPRGFRYAYADYARDGDRWTRPSSVGGSKASHAHQLLLELWAETGAFGLLGYLCMLIVLARAWRHADATARRRALPFGVALVGMLFPLNTHPAWYSSFSASLLWFFIGLYLFALCREPAR